MYAVQFLVLNILIVLVSSNSYEDSQHIRKRCELDFTKIVTRIKRSRYSGLPPLYRRPLRYDPAVKGVYSFTPPPNYLSQDDGKFFRKPPGSNPLTTDDDITEVLNKMSPTDLEMLMNYVRKKKSNRAPSIESFSHNSGNGAYLSQSGNKLGTFVQQRALGTEISEDDLKDFNQLANRGQDTKERPEFNDINQFIAGPYRSDLNNFGQIKPGRNEMRQKPKEDDYNENILNPPPNYKNLESDFSVVRNYLNGPLLTHLNEAKGTENANIPVKYTDQLDLKDEQLPKPVNLRQEDEMEYYGAEARKRQSYAKAPAVSEYSQTQSDYQLKSVKELPLSQGSAKFKSLNSYSVPHYSVTSGASQQVKSSHGSSNEDGYSYNKPKQAKAEESESSLRAVSIWTHKSVGTAYTLHDDGTLTLEKAAKKAGY